MRHRSAADIIKDLIVKKTTKVGVASNLNESLVQHPTSPVSGDTVSAEWRVHFMSSVQYLTPMQIYNRLASEELAGSPVFGAEAGVLRYTSGRSGLRMFSTIVNAPSSFGFRIEVDAPNQNISVYSNTALIRRSANLLRATVNVQEGLSPLFVVVVGPAGQINITIPADINAVLSDMAPPAPIWRSPTAIETNYIDPKSGNTGNALYWYNHPQAGGWGVYRITTTNYGTTTSVERTGNQYIVAADAFSGVIPVAGMLRVGDVTVGSITRASLTSADTSIDVDIDFDLEDIDTVSGSVDILTFDHLQDVVKTSGTSVISLVDVNVQSGTEYSYILDSFSPFDRGLRSEKSEIKTVVAGDSTPPASIGGVGVEVINGVVYVSYTTPGDTDYLGTRVYFETSSGVYDSVVTDYGRPSTADSLSFLPVDSGTYYLVTFDQVANEQDVGDGVSWVWDGVSGESTGGSVSDLPPDISIVQLTGATQSTITGYSDTRNYAVVEISGTDPIDGPGEVTLFYLLRDEVEQSLAATEPAGPSVDDPGGTRSRWVALERQQRDNWIRVRAEDAGGLSSETYTYTVDYDNTPEISSLDSYLDTIQNKVFFTGTVDDDASSLEWKLDSDSPTLINNLDTTKTFSFNFTLLDGQKKLVTITPYSELSAGGEAGNPYTREWFRSPRTVATFEDKNENEEYSKTSVKANLRVTPAISNVDSGTCSGSGTTVTLVDTTRSWTTDQYNPSGDVIYYVRVDSGTGYAASWDQQLRKIIDTSATQLTVDQNWLTIPDATSHYTIQAGAMFIDVGELGNFSPIWRPVYFTRGTAETKIVQFYSRISGVPAEPIQSVIVDPDNIPSLQGFSLVEYAAGEIKASISNPDDDAKDWMLFARKDNWPTNDDTQTGDPDFDYLRWKGPVSTKEVIWAAGTGDWKAVALPIDAYNNVGLALTATVTIAGAAGPGALSSLSVVANDDVSDDYNNVRWNHNDTVDTYVENGTASSGSDTTHVEDDSKGSWGTDEYVDHFVEITSGALNGEVRRITANNTNTLTVTPAFSQSPDTMTYEIYQHYVRIWAYRQDKGSETETEITTVKREPRLDTGANFDNSDDENTVADKGSFLHQITDEDRGDVQTGVLRTWKYRVELHEADLVPTLQETYNVNHQDYFIETIPSFSVGATSQINTNGICFVTPHQKQIDWTIVNPNNASYQIDIDLAEDASGTDFNLLVTGLLTTTDRYLHDETEFEGGGELDTEERYWRYKVKIVRKSDSQVIEESTTTQLDQLTTNCEE